MGVSLLNGCQTNKYNDWQQAINALTMMLVMNSIVFYNAERYKKIFQYISESCPATWEHVRLLGDYRFTLGL